MLKSKRVFNGYFLYLILSAACVWAEPLEWADCVNEARKNHPELISALEKISQAKHDKSIVRSALLPSVHGSAEASRTRDLQNRETASYPMSLNGQQLVFDGFKTVNQLKSSGKLIDSALYRYYVISSDIRLRLRTAFVELLRAYEFAKIAEIIYDRRKQNLELVKLRYDAGREHKGSLMTAQANYAQAEFEVLQSKRDIELAKRKLSRELGRRFYSELKITGSLEIPQMDKKIPDFESIASTNPFLKDLIAVKDAAKHNADAAKSDFLPQVFLFGSVGKDRSEFFSSREELTGGISAEIPIFEGGRRFYGYRKSKSLFRQSEADVLNGFDSVLLTLRETWKLFVDSIDLISVQEKFLSASEERAKIAQAQYATGLISFDNWIIIEDDLVRDRKAYLNSLSNALIAEANWNQAKGETLGEIDK